MPFFLFSAKFGKQTKKVPSRGVRGWFAFEFGCPATNDYLRCMFVRRKHNKSGLSAFARPIWTYVQCIIGYSTGLKLMYASALLHIQSCWNWNVYWKRQDPKYHWTEHAFWRRRYTKLTTSILTMASKNQCFCIPKNSLKLPNFWKSSPSTAKLGVPLRKTGRSTTAITESESSTVQTS